MKPERFELLSSLHQQFQESLHNTASAIQTADGVITEELLQIKRQIKIIASFCMYYIAAEEAILFPLLHNYEPALVAILRDDYHKCSNQVNDFYNLVTEQECCNTLNRISFLRKLSLRFTAFTDDCLRQMNEHKAMLNPVVWRYFGDEELRQLAALVNAARSACCNKRITGKKQKKRTINMPDKRGIFI